MNAIPESAGRELLSQLADIKGLRPVSIWPLAPGWWLVVAATVLASATMAIFAYRAYRWRRSWRRDAFDALTNLERGLTLDNAHATLAALSGVLRRIAIRRYSRTQCAGLEGRPWLAWLDAHDPQGFIWSVAGRPLIDGPYRRPHKDYEPDGISELIRAARKWVA